MFVTATAILLVISMHFCSHYYMPLLPLFPAIFICADAVEFEKYRNCDAIVFTEKLAVSEAQKAL